MNVHVGERVGPFVVVANESTIPARKRRVVVRCVACERVSEMNERSLLDKRTEEQRACAKCRVYTTNGTWTKGWRSKMENAAIEANRLNKENADLRDEIDKVLRERDEARAAEEHLRGQHQYSVGLSMALEERDQARRERDLSRQAEERARESLEELDAAIYECLPGDDDDSPLDCVERAGDKLRELAQDRDEWRDKFHALNQTAGEICNACGWAFKIPGESCRCEVVKERDEARAEVERVRKRYAESVIEHGKMLVEAVDSAKRQKSLADHAHNQACMLAAKLDARSTDHFRRGAEAMREACAEACRPMLRSMASRSELADALRALPIPEEP